MRERRLRAIVLRRRNIGEADQLITLFTKEQGKLVVLAKGIRRPRAKLVGHLEPFAQVRITVSEGRRSPILTSVQEMGQPITDELFIFGVKYFFVELIDGFFLDHDPHPRVYQGLKEALELISRGGDGRVVTAFALLVIREAGFQPIMTHCVHCQESRDQFARFSIGEGGVVCASCAVPDAKLVDPQVIIALAHGSVNLNSKNFTVLSRLVTEFLSYRLGSELKTRQLLRSLQAVKD